MTVHTIEALRGSTNWAVVIRAETPLPHDVRDHKDIMGEHIVLGDDGQGQQIDVDLAPGRSGDRGRTL